MQIFANAISSEIQMLAKCHYFPFLVNYLATKVVMLILVKLSIQCWKIYSLIALTTVSFRSYHVRFHYFLIFRFMQINRQMSTLSKIECNVWVMRLQLNWNLCCRKIFAALRVNDFLSVNFRVHFSHFYLVLDLDQKEKLISNCQPVELWYLGRAL